MLTEALRVIIEQDPNSWIVLHSDHGPDIPRLADMNRMAARLANFIAIRSPGGTRFKVDFHSPLGAWRRVLDMLAKTETDLVERYFYIPDEESSSIKSWKEFTIEELQTGIGGAS
jgi:hypothetical protein